MTVVELERREHIALVTLNRPEARNAISPEVSQAMAAVLDEIESDAELRAVVVTGRGEVFSAGADLKVVAAGNANDIARGKGGFAGIVTRDFPKPIIAAVNGPALAGGFEIVLSCDLVVAAVTQQISDCPVGRHGDADARAAPPGLARGRDRQRRALARRADLQPVGLVDAKGVLAGATKMRVWVFVTLTVASVEPTPRLVVSTVAVTVTPPDGSGPLDGLTVMNGLSEVTL